MFSPWLQLKLVYTFKHSPPCITTGPTQIKRFTMDLSNYKRDHWILKLIFYLHYLNPDVWKVLSVCGDIVYQRFATSLEIHSHPWRRTLCQMFVYQFRKLELSFWSVMLYFSIRAQIFTCPIVLINAFIWVQNELNIWNVLCIFLVISMPSEMHDK